MRIELEFTKNEEKWGFPDLTREYEERTPKLESCSKVSIDPYVPFSYSFLEVFGIYFHSNGNPFMCHKILIESQFGLIKSPFSHLKHQFTTKSLVNHHWIPIFQFNPSLHFTKSHEITIKAHWTWGSLLVAHQGPPTDSGSWSPGSNAESRSEEHQTWRCGSAAGRICRKWGNW